MAKCFECKNKISFGGLKTSGKDLKKGKIMMGIDDEAIDRMGEKDVICGECGNAYSNRHALAIYNWYKKNNTPELFESWRNNKDSQPLVKEAEKLITEQNNKSKNHNPPIQTKTITSKSKVSNTMVNNSSFMSKVDLDHLLVTKHDQTKDQWDKNGVVQFKDEGIAILQRMWGSQVQFIVACSQITKEGYRLMAIDEGKEGSSGGFSGGVNAYFYFQKMDFVR